MQEDAGALDADRGQRVLEAQARALQAEANESAAPTSRAAFLESTRTAAYLTEAPSLEERLQQNRHYGQKGADQDTFLAKPR